MYFALIVLTNCDYQLTASPCVLFNNRCTCLNTSGHCFLISSLNGAINCCQSDINCEKNVSSAKTTDERNVRNVRNSWC